MTHSDQRRVTFLGDRIEAERDGEEIVIWNHVTVKERSEVRATEIASSHQVFVGDGSVAKAPEYITPEIDRQLQRLDIYPTAEVVDPNAEEVTVR
jgi:hypothetical protein